jgi:hypothetical protein
MKAFFDENESEYDPNECILRRELQSSGKSRAFINDSPAPLTLMKELGEQLIDVHSQHQNLLLSKEDFQLNVLDALANDEKELSNYKESYHNYRKVVEELDKLIELEEQSKADEDYVRFQLDQFDEAKRITGFNKAMLGDFGQLEEIAKNRYLRREFDAMEFMGVNPATIGLIEHTDYSSSELETPNLCARYGTESMIGLVRLWAFLPRRGLDTWDQIEEAYKASKIFLEPINSANHFQYGELLSLKDVESLVQATSMLIREIEQHKVFYEEIAGRRSGLLTAVKSLFVRLAQETVKVNFKNSTALPLYLKSSLVTKVYLVGAIDLHDHSNRVVANALSFAEAVLSKYD